MSSIQWVGSKVKIFKQFNPSMWNSKLISTMEIMIDVAVFVKEMLRRESGAVAVYNGMHKFKFGVRKGSILSSVNNGSVWAL